MLRYALAQTRVDGNHHTFTPWTKPEMQNALSYNSRKQNLSMHCWIVEQKSLRTGSLIFCWTGSCSTLGCWFLPNAATATSARSSGLTGASGSDFRIRVNRASSNCKTQDKQLWHCMYILIYDKELKYTITHAESECNHRIHNSWSARNGRPPYDKSLGLQQYRLFPESYHALLVFQGVPGQDRSLLFRRFGWNLAGHDRIEAFAWRLFLNKVQDCLSHWGFLEAQTVYLAGLSEKQGWRVKPHAKP